MVWAERIPQSAAFRSLVPTSSGNGWEWALRGGEDYELLFSAPPERASDIAALGREWACGITLIGRIEPLCRGVIIQDEGRAVDPALLKGYDHFA